MLRPINDNIVIIPDKRPEQIGGIILPETSNKAPETGVVFKSNFNEISEGVAVVFKKYGTTTITIDKDEYLVVPREDILAIIED